jgi:hypothetical protein
VTAADAVTAIGTGAIGGLPKSPVVQAVTTEIGNASPKIYDSVNKRIDQLTTSGASK